MVLSSGAAYQLLLHDACLSSELISRTNIIAALSSYSSWVRLISLTTSSPNPSAPCMPDELCMEEQFQTYLFVLSMMKRAANAESILIYVTGQTQSLHGLYHYENLATQLVAMGSRCLILDLSGRSGRDFRAEQLFARVSGASMDFVDVIPCLPDQTNPVHFAKDQQLAFRPQLNSDILAGEGKGLVALKEEFRDRLDRFLFVRAEVKPKRSPTSPSWRASMPTVEVYSYSIRGTIADLQNARTLETFRIRTSNSDMLKASLRWKPNVKIVYVATANEGTISVTIRLRTLRSVFCAMLSSEAAGTANSLLGQLRRFIAGVQATDGVVNKLCLLGKDWDGNARLMQEVATLPVCVYHKWFCVKTVDVVYAGKVSVKKSRASYLTDYILLKKSLAGIFRELNLTKVEGTIFTHFVQFERGFVLVRPVFFMSNVATLYSSFYDTPETQISAFTKRLREQIALVRKLRTFVRPLHFAVVYQPVTRLAQAYHEREGARVSMSKTFLRDIEEAREGEGPEFSLEEAERELESQHEAEQVGASVYTFVPYPETVKNYMQRKKWSWSCPHHCVLKGFITLLAKQRRYEGFVLLNADRDVITLVKEEKVKDCSMEEEGRTLIEYMIKFSPIDKLVETELYVEKKDCSAEIATGRTEGLFELLTEELYRVDTEISKIIWSYHSIKRECLRACVARKQNSLKHCGFFFDFQESNVLPELLLIKVCAMLAKCYELYASKKYPEIQNAISQPTVKVGEGFSMDCALLYQNSAALDVQSLMLVKRASVLAKDGVAALDEACYKGLLATLQGVITKIMEEFADAAFPLGNDSSAAGAKKVYAKIVSKKQIVLIKVSNAATEGTLAIEYRQLSKDCFAVFDNMLMERDEQKRQSSKKERCKDNIKDEFIRQLLEDAELDFDAYAEPEIHEVHFEISLLKVVKNFEAYISEEYNSQLLAFCYEQTLKGYRLSQDVLESVLGNAHRFTFSFNLSSLFMMYAAINIRDVDTASWGLRNAASLDSQFKALLGTFFRELPDTGFYYYSPKPSASYTRSDKSLAAELETLFGTSTTGTQPDGLPLFARLTATFRRAGRVLDSRVIRNFRDLCAPEVVKRISEEKAEDATLWEEVQKLEVSMNVVLYIVGRHKVFEDERYYERKDIEDAITMEDYYDQISEGVGGFELGLAAVLAENVKLSAKVSVNMGAYMEEGAGECLIYPFQSRLYLQLIPENYLRGNFVFTVPDEYIRAFYAILRPVKSFLAELTLLYATNLCITHINKDLMTYIRLKMGELYSDHLERQVHRVFFVNYSEQAQEIFNAELDSRRYNLRRIEDLKSFYFVVWPCGTEALQLDGSCAVGEKGNTAAYGVKYWVLLKSSFNRDIVTMQLNAHFPLGEIARDTSDTLKEAFAKTFKSISKRVNQQILLNVLNERKKCPKLLFPREKPRNRDIPNSEKKKERRPTDRMCKLLQSTRKSIREAPTKEEEKENTPCVAGALDAYKPTLIFTTEFPVTERVTIKSLGDVRSGFLKSFAVSNRECMYVMSKDRAIYVIRFTDPPHAAAKQTTTPSIVMELYGIEEAPKEFVDNLLMTVESQLTMIALTKIAKNITQNINMCSGPLSIYDYRFLSQSEHQVVFSNPSLTMKK